MTGTPDEVRDVDGGDETARRFVYQYTYAAILACALLDDTADVEELFCEHHEDVLLQHGDGTFTGCQVKTRQEGGEQWVATEKQILGAVARFVVLESTFPGSFRRFVIASNHPFKQGDAGNRLPYLLAQAQECPDSESAEPKLQRFIRRLARKTSCSEDVVLSALRKCRCRDDLPKLKDVLKILCSDLSQTWPGAGECSMDVLMEVARRLVGLCQEASTLAHEQLLPRYLGAIPGPDEEGVASRITGKRIDRARVEAVLSQAVTATAALDGPTDGDPEIGAGRRSVLEQKLDRAGFSAVSVNSANDLRAKADYLALQWCYRLGEGGLRRRSHIRSLVLADCATAHESLKTEDRPFGFPMLSALRELFRLRREAGDVDLYDCSDAHLEGCAYVLTSECKVWWSFPFELSEDQ